MRVRRPLLWLCLVAAVALAPTLVGWSEEEPASQEPAADPERGWRHLLDTPYVPSQMTQEVFDNLGGHLAIQTARVGFAAFFEEIGRVGLVTENKGNTAVTISGTKVREQLNAGQIPDPRIMRESTAKILVEYYASKNA